MLLRLVNYNELFSSLRSEIGHTNVFYYTFIRAFAIAIVSAQNISKVNSKLNEILLGIF